MTSIESWVDAYRSREASSMRGGRRAKPQSRILQDLKKANGVEFPSVGVLTLIWWAFKIWLALRNP